MRIRHLLAASGVAIAALLVPAATPRRLKRTTRPRRPSTTSPIEAAEHCVHLLEDGKTVDDCQKSPNPLLPETNEIIWGGGAFVIVLVRAQQARLPGDQEGHGGPHQPHPRVHRRGRPAQGRSRHDADRVPAPGGRRQGRSGAHRRRSSSGGRSRARRPHRPRRSPRRNEIRAKAREDVEASKARAITELQAQVGDLTIALAEKIVERSLDTEANRALIDNYITNLGNK